MARPPRFAISALADLLHELRYAPPETLSRQMQAAEKLLTEIQIERNYPEDYIRYRITGFRGEQGGGSVFVGSALLGDIAKFVERLSASLGWPVEHYAPRKALLPDEVARRLGISAVTLHRYRKQGLVAHQAVIDGGRLRLVYFEDAVERFAAQHQAQMSHAARFKRIDTATRERIIRRARRYAQTLDLSLNESAKHLAKRFYRSHEGIRRLLKQHDLQHPEAAIFSDAAPLTDRQRRLVFRAHDRALPVLMLAGRLGKSVNTIYRTVLEQRAARLRGWQISAVELPTFRLEGAEDVILNNSAVAAELPIRLNTGGDFAEWTTEATRLQISSEDEETQCVAGLHYLLWSVQTVVAGLDRHQPKAIEIDLAETRLRWATRLKAKLLAGLRSSLISTAEIHLGRKLEQSPTVEIESAYRLIITAGARAIEAFDPSRQGRLVQVAIHTLRSGLARRAASPVPSSTARAKYDHRSIVLPDLGSVLFPWRWDLELRSGAVDRADALGEEARLVLGARFGWAGRAPQTQAALAASLGRPVHRIAAAEQRARRQLAQIMRSSPVEPA